jgi:hypothetical protein
MIFEAYWLKCRVCVFSVNCARLSNFNVDANFHNAAYRPRIGLKFGWCIHIMYTFRLVYLLGHSDIND